MDEATFEVTSVDELFDVSAGLVLISAAGMMVPLDVESYAAAKQLIAESEGVSAEEVSLVGRTLVLNEDGVPVVPEAD